MVTEPEEPRPEEEEEDGGGPIKSFLEHLEDLRWVIIKVVAALVIAMAVCMTAAPKIIAFLQWPLWTSVPDVKLEWLSPIGGVVALMKVALWGGITVALPFVLYFIGEFILPALKKNEKIYFLRAFIIGGGLFVAGVMLCYFLILPISLKGITAFNAWLGVPTSIWRGEDYFSFVVMFMIGMGLSFEFPLILLTLVRMGIVSHQFMVKGRKYFFVGNLVLCAFITPDAVSTIFMVIPVQVLLEICIWISAYWERQKRRAAAAAEAAEASGQTPPTD